MILVKSVADTIHLFQHVSSCFKIAENRDFLTSARCILFHLVSSNPAIIGVMVGASDSPKEGNGVG